MCPFKMSLSPKLWLPLGVELVQSFLGISRIGIGGKHFPGISYPVVRRDPAACLSLLSLQVDEDREKPVAVAV